MILALRSAAPEIDVFVGDRRFSWEAGRGLAKDLPGYLEECLSATGARWSDLTGLVVFRGTGSFTGLRIGITVMNTIAAAQSIPIVGTMGGSWLATGRDRLAHGDNDRIVLPEYGSEPHITVPKH